MASSVTPLAAALIGAGGAVLGGFLTTSGQLLIERGRAKRERRAEADRAKRELRLAARLVMEELAESMVLIQKSARSRRYWVGPRALPTTTWNQYRTVIAAGIDSALDWRLVTAAYDAINNLNWLVEHRRRTEQRVSTGVEGAIVNEHDETRAVWRASRSALHALERTVEVSGPASRLLHDQDDLELEFWPYGDGDDFDLDAAMVADQEAWHRDQLRRQELGR